MRSLTDYYGNDNRSFMMQEGLSYISIERLVRFFYESGKAPVDDYVYYANKMVEIVFSYSKDIWLEKYRDWYDTMRRGDKGTRTFDRMGTKTWTDIFRAFYFASAKWSETEKETNVSNLLDLYALQENTVEVGKNTFNQDFIEEWVTVWETLPSVSCFSKAFRYICSLEITGNFNQYGLFSKFLGRSVEALYMNGFIMRPEPWKYETLLGGGQIADVYEVADEIMSDTLRSINKVIKVLEQVPKIRPLDLQMYRDACNYFRYMQDVIAYERSAPLKERPTIVTEIHDVTAEKSKEIEKMEDGDFWTAIKDNENNLPVIDLVELVNRRLKQNKDN